MRELYKQVKGYSPPEDITYDEDGKVVKKKGKRDVGPRAGD